MRNENNFLEDNKKKLGESFTKIGDKVLKKYQPNSYLETPLFQDKLQQELIELENNFKLGKDKDYKSGVGIWNRFVNLLFSSLRKKKEYRRARIDIIRKHLNLQYLRNLNQNPVKDWMSIITNSCIASDETEKEWRTNHFSALILHLSAEIMIINNTLIELGIKNWWLDTKNEAWWLFRLFRICAFDIANQNNFQEDLSTSDKKLIDELIKKFGVLYEFEYEIMKVGALNTFEDKFGHFSREFLVLENMLHIMYQICRNIKNPSTCHKVLTKFIKLLIIQSSISMRDQKVVGNIFVISEKRQKVLMDKEDELLKELSEEFKHFISVYYCDNDIDTASMYEVLILNPNNTSPPCESREYFYKYF